MTRRRDRVFAVWRRTFSLSWPVAVQQGLNTLMRTTDIIVTGLFSPAAIAAIGLADLYSQLPLRFGLGFGAGAIALSSQDTGRGAGATRDRAITQALVLGLVVGVPLMVGGLLFGRTAIAVLGATPEVVRMGGTYLAIVFAAAPMRILGLVGSRALQGTGDTRTPMYVNGAGSAINILLSVGLGLGVGPLPELAIVGVGVATAVSRTLVAVTFVGALASGRMSASLARPRDLTITRQLVAVSLPNVAEGLSFSLASFPFNAILLTFGTEVTAAYHVGRRAYQQIGGPLYRAYGTAASIIVGQTLGEGDHARARFNGFAMTALSVLTMGGVAVVLIVAAEPLVRVFTQDPVTVGHAIDFTRTFGASMVFFGLFFTFAGSLRGAGDTRTPLYARLSGTLLFFLGFSYVAGVVLGYGLPAIYAGILLTYAWWTLVVVAGFLWGDWAADAAAMMAERAASDD